jgi:hypothetical protein
MKNGWNLAVKKGGITMKKMTSGILLPPLVLRVEAQKDGGKMKTGHNIGAVTMLTKGKNVLIAIQK